MTEQGATTLAAALVALQAEMPTIHKGQTAKVEKDGRTLYSYSYAGLPDVVKIAYPLLTKHGLSFVTLPQHVDGVGFVLVGMLRHISGEYVEGMLPIVGRDAQAIGSSLTYNRRYLLGCLTGLVTDDDEDGAGATRAGADRPDAYQPPQIPSRAEIEAKLQATVEGIGRPVTELREWWHRLSGIDSTIELGDEALYAFTRAVIEHRAELSA